MSRIIQPEIVTLGGDWRGDGPSNQEIVTSSYNETDLCVPLDLPFLSGLSIFPALVALVNSFILLALFFYRKKLKQENVYRYVVSTLTANFVLSALTFYHFLNYYYGFEPHTPSLLWALRKGVTLTLCLVMCGNIGLLIYGIDGSTYTVGRNLNKRSHNLNPIYRRRKANVLICAVWAFPVLYGSLSMTSWNCTTGQCSCTLHFESDRPSCVGVQCSQLYTPMSKSYLFSIVLLLALEWLGLLILLCKSINSLRIIHSKKQQVWYASVKRAVKKYTEKNWVVLILFGLFFLCTAPVMTLVLLDFLIPDFPVSVLLINCVLPLPLIYCLISPFLIAHKLTKLKLAIINLITITCPCKSEEKSKGPKKICKDVAPESASKTVTITLV